MSLCLCCSMSHTLAHTRPLLPWLENSPATSSTTECKLHTKDNVTLFKPCCGPLSPASPLHYCWHRYVHLTHFWSIQLGCEWNYESNWIVNPLLLMLFCCAPDSGSFLIFNENHNKCIKVESATSLTVAPCDPHAKAQQFRWASESRVLSLSLKLCLGATEIKDWVKVVLFECDENSDLQHWQCKNETLFGLKDQDLHLNWGNRNERSIMIYKGSGLWSRWRIFGTRGDLCSKGYQGRNCWDTINRQRQSSNSVYRGI